MRTDGTDANANAGGHYTFNAATNVIAWVDGPHHAAYSDAQLGRRDNGAPRWRSSRTSAATGASMQSGADSRDGYSIHADVFTKAEMSSVLDALDAAAFTRTKAGARHVLSLPVIRALASDRRLLEIAARVLGATAHPFRATLFDKSPTSNWLVAWHQDTALPLRARVENVEWSSWSEKGGVLHAHAPAWALESVVALRVHLDDSTATNGPLRVLPRTHALGVLSDETMKELSRTVTPVDCVAPFGGVVAMRPLIVHASSKVLDGGSRRVIHIEYATSMRLAEGIELALS